MNLEQMKEQLISWISELHYASYKPEDYLYVFDDNIKIRLYTDNNCYSICAVPISDNHPRSYLGCISAGRKARAGEDWNRGNDLADGEFNEETWNRILKDIVGYELVKIHRPTKYLFEKQEFEGKRVIIDPEKW